MKEDVVNNPSHYTDGGIETIDFIEAKQLDFCLANAVKYISRAGKKDPSKKLEDLLKARWYISREIMHLSGNDIDEIDNDMDNDCGEEKKIDLFSDDDIEISDECIANVINAVCGLVDEISSAKILNAAEKYEGEEIDDINDYSDCCATVSTTLLDGEDYTIENCFEDNIEEIKEEIEKLKTKIDNDKRLVMDLVNAFDKKIEAIKVHLDCRVSGIDLKMSKLREEFIELLSKKKDKRNKKGN